MLLFAGVSVLQIIPNFVLVLSTCMRSIISKKKNFEKMTYRMVLAVCGSYIATSPPCHYLSSYESTKFLYSATFHLQNMCGGSVEKAHTDSAIFVIIICNIGLLEHDCCFDVMLLSFCEV